MAKQNVTLYQMNAGLISDLAQVRADLERLALSADVMTNWMPRTLGSMMLRPGLGYKGTTRNNAKAYHIPFVFSGRSDGKALLEFTEGFLRPIVSDNPVTRPSVSTSITNGLFTTDLSGWTDGDETGATSSWNSGYMSLLGSGSNDAIRSQLVSVASGDIGKQHALRVYVERYSIRLKIGTTAGAGDILKETRLGEGVHSLAFTPTASFYVTLSNETTYPALIERVVIEGAGSLELEVPYSEEDLPLIRADQSGDVVYVTCDGYAPYKVERRGQYSWSFVSYVPLDGPFNTINTSSTVLTPSANYGTITLASSKDLFTANHIGSLWGLQSLGQLQNATIAGVGQATAAIKVSGTDAQRYFSIYTSGTWSGVIELQRSIGEEGAWETYSTYTSSNVGVINWDDGYDGQTIYYRLVATSWAGGSAWGTLKTTGGITSGLVRITGYSSPKIAVADVIKTLGRANATTDWKEGQWSDENGYPTATLLSGGRLFFFGRDAIVGSVSDAYESYDDSIEGDSAPLNRTIGSGPVDSIKWALDLQRIALGGEMAEHMVYATTLDDVLTPSNMNCKAATTQGSSDADAIKIGSTGVFVSRCGTRLISLYPEGSSGQYGDDDLTKYYPEAGEAGIVRLAVQRKPDTRIHAVLDDGTAFVLLFSKIDNINCIIRLGTDGVIEDVVVEPGAKEDAVTYAVARTINGQTVRCRERFALESECQGGLLNKQADCFGVYDGAATATITGADHLEGREVVVWADGKDVGTKTVTGGSFTLDAAASKVVYGLPYEARWRSVKLAYGATGGTSFGMIKTLFAFAPILKNTHAQGLKYGPSFDALDDMPLVEDGANVDPDTIWPLYDKTPFEFDGDYEEDPRICLVAAAPRPCTVMGLVLQVETNG